MTSRGRKFLTKSLVLGLTAIALAGCVTPEASTETGRYTAPIGGSPVIANETPYSDGLRCMANYTHAKPVRIAVGQIADYTGKISSDNSGREITQGAALMAMSALSKAGVPLVERFDTSVAEMELKYANNKLISGDGPQSGPQGSDYREDLAVVAALRSTLRAVAGDQLVVRIFQFHLGDGGVETLDQRNARLGERAHRHQGRALGDFTSGVV